MSKEITVKDPQLSIESLHEAISAIVQKNFLSQSQDLSHSMTKFELLLSSQVQKNG